MRFKNLYLLLIVLMVAMFSCKKDINEQPGDVTNKTMEELNIPNDFDWRTTRDIDLKVNVKTATATQARSKISVYTSDPANGGKMIAAGTAADGAAFSGVLRIPAYLTEVYLVCEFPFGASQHENVSVAGDMIDYTFDASQPEGFKVVPVGPDCSSGCDETISGTVNEDIEISDSKTVCITGTFTGEVTYKGDGGTLRICGDATIQKIKYNGNPTMMNLVITETGTMINDGNLNLTQLNEIINYGTITYVDDNMSTNGVLENYGLIDVEQNLDVTGSSSALINECKILTGGSFYQHWDLYNYGYIGVGGTFDVSNNTTTEMFDAALVDATNLQISGTVNGTGNYSMLHATGVTHLNGGSAITGNMDICDDNGIEHSNGTIGPDVTYCEAFIPATDCNPGYGNPPDTDGDGCPDNVDEFPTDPERCYTDEGDWETLAYEDLWPSTGDYDFNDNVIIVKTDMVYNSQNELVDINSSYKVTAVGASFKNGLAIQFDNLNPDDITSASGSVITGSYATLNANGTESGPDKAVVYVFDNSENVIHRAGGPFFNTLENGNIGTSDVTEITIYFNPAIDPAMVGNPPFNPFLIKNGNRDIEIHLPNYEPTSLADPSYFGTVNDDSDPLAGRYYKTKENLPWGIYIPEVLDHMIEYIEIPEGYLHFSEWAESSGATYNDWYKDLPGYRDNSKIWYAD